MSQTSVQQEQVLAVVEQDQTQAQMSVQVLAVDPRLSQAAQLFTRLNDDIQLHLIEEYIKPQLRGDDLVREFDKQLNSEECSNLNWQVLVDVVEKIIENEAALAQMCEKYEASIGFKRYYDQHFIQKVNSFKAPSWDPLSSFCASLTMCKWH